MSINRRRISLSIASGLLLEVINKISPLLILHHAQKTLGLPDFGWAQYQLALFEAVQPFVTYGFASYALAEGSAKENAKGELQGLFSHILVLKLLNALFVSLFYFISHQGHADKFSFDILLVVMISSVADSFWYCIARHKLATMSLVSGGLRIVALVFILSFIQTPQDKNLFVMLSLLPNALIAIVTGLYAYRELAFSKIIGARLKRIFISSTPFALIVLLVTILDRLDIFLVEKWFGMEVAGIYAGPAKVVQSLSMIASSLALPFYAEILKVTDPKSLYKHVSLSLWCLSALIAPIIFGLPFIEGDVLRILFTRLPDSVNHLLSLLSLGMIGTVLLSVFGLQILMSKARPWAIIHGGILCIVMVSALVYVGKANFGFQAAAYSIIFGKIAIGLYCMHFAKEFLPNVPWLSFVKPLLAGAGMGLCLKLIGVEGLVLNVGLGAVTYALCLLVTNFKEFKEIIQHPKVQALLRRNK